MGTNVTPYPARHQCRRALIGGTLYWVAIQHTPRTQLDLENTKADALWDDESSWPAPGMLRIDGFVYKEFRRWPGGVCGTDREICAFQYGTRPDGTEHLIIGHESLGEVVEVGSAVSRLKRGDLVIPTVRRPCTHDDCAACRSGRQDFCFTGDFSERGIKNLHGFMTEFVVDDERYMHVVPPALRDVAVLVEPLTIAEKAMNQVDQVQQRLPWACEIEPGKARRTCHR
jgi:hypothetical protein